MPWNEVSAMSLRTDFVHLALAEGANIRELCRRFSVSPKVAYKERAGNNFPTSRGL
jgi:transposase-like protein